MRRKTVQLVALALLVAGAAAAKEEGRVRLAVADFHVVKKLEAEEPELGPSLAAVASDLLSVRFDVLGRTDFLGVLRDRDISPTFLHECAADRARAAEAAGVEILVTGRVSTFGDRIVLHLRVSDRADRGYRGAVMVDVDRLEGLPDAVAEALRQTGLLREEERDQVRAATVPEERRAVSDAMPRGDVERWTRWVRLHPVLGKLAVHPFARPPWIVFVEGDQGEWGERYLDALGKLYVEFRSLLGEGHDLPHLWGRERGDERKLKVFVFASPESFAAYHEAVGMTLPSGVLSYYRPDDQWVMAARPADPADLVKRLRHEATHQLVHVYAKICLERETGQEVGWTDPRLRSRLYAVQEGFAEVMAWGEAPDVPRLREIRATRRRKQAEWSFGDLLAPRSSREMLRKAAEKGGITGGGRMASLFHAQAWALCHYLLYGAGDAGRERFLDYLRAELRGRSGPGEFGRIFWGADERDREVMQRGFEKHVESLLEGLEDD